jgi:cytochrome c oxidase cbb3-type subunit 3
MSVRVEFAPKEAGNGTKNFGVSRQESMAVMGRDLHNVNQRTQPEYRLMLTLLLLVACLGNPLFSLFSVSAQDARKPVKIDTMANDQVRRGMRQFQQSCGMCHGSEAKGGSGPSLIDSSLVRHDRDGDLIKSVLREGRSEKGMPAFPALSDTQVVDLVAFLHASIEASDNSSPEGGARGYSLQQLSAGNVEAGREFFSRQGKCVACHSASGDLKGIAAKYSPLELETRLLYPPIGSNSCVVSLPSGEKIKGQLLHLDPFFVAIRDESGIYHSWPLLQNVTVKVADPLRVHIELLNSYKDKDIHDVFAYLETLH